jgi:uncharacterized protein YchJ
MWFLALLLLVASPPTMVSMVLGYSVIPRSCARSSSYQLTTRLYAGFGAKKDGSESKALDVKSPCACGSGSSYGDCCEQYHSGKAIPPTPIKVVRSRFSALAYKMIQYVISTTHPSHKEFVDDEQKSKRKVWEKDLKAFADEYNFVSLVFDDETRDNNVAADATSSTVSFTAKLQRVSLGERPDETIKEVSTFKRDSPTAPWLYADAIVKSSVKNIQMKVTPQQRAVKTLLKGVPNGNQN